MIKLVLVLIVDIVGKIMGAKLDKESAANPTITENALKKIPLPVVHRVTCAASL